MAENLDSEQFRNFTIIGLGLIGGSIAKDIRACFPDATITAIDRDISQIDLAIDEGNVDQSIEYEDIAKMARFVIIATPIESVIPAAKRIATESSKYKNKLLVIDTASVKSDISKVFESLSRPELEFIGTHPMAGTEFTGYAHARKHLFRAKPWMVTPHSLNTKEGVELAELFIGALGGRIRELDPSDHDRLVARTSHAVIMLSNYLFDFVASSDPGSLELAGDGFTSTTRLASGNPQLHADILNGNRVYTKEVLTEFLAYLEGKLDEGLTDQEAFFVENMKRRNHWLHKRK